MHPAVEVLGTTRVAIRKCPAPAPAEPAPWPAERPRPKFLSDLLLDQTNGKPTAKRGDGGSGESESQVGSDTAAAEPKPSAATSEGRSFPRAEAPADAADAPVPDSREGETAADPAAGEAAAEEEEADLAVHATEAAEEQLQSDAAEPKSWADVVAHGPEC